MCRGGDPAAATLMPAPKATAAKAAAEKASAVGGQWHNGAGFFKMPLQYPQYTRAQYEAMEEAQLDFLLREYGLPCDGRDVAEKREDAIGHFLWESGGDG